MKWRDFYDAFWDWSDSTRRTRISSLEDIGPGDEVVDAVLEIEDPKVKAQLIRKAMKLGAKFSNDDLCNLDTELPDDLFQQLGCYAGIDTDELYDDEEETVPVEYQLKNALDNFATDEQITQLEKDVEVLCKQLDEKYPEPTPQEQAKETAKGVFKVLGIITASILGVFGLFLGVIFSLTKKYDGRSTRHRSPWGHSHKKAKKKSRHCDGDCDNCPAHYGYRYGRWYYGHGHQWGCERGGNGGRRGLTLRD